MSYPKGSSQRRYSPVEKENAVRLVRLRREETGESHGSVKAVAEQLGFGVESVRAWVKQADIDDGVKPGTTTADAERIKALEQELKELRRANAILQIGVGFLCGGTRPPTSVMVDYIDQHRLEFGVESICNELPIAPSTYYAAKTARAVPTCAA